MQPFIVLRPYIYLCFQRITAVVISKHYDSRETVEKCYENNADAEVRKCSEINFRF